MPTANDGKHLFALFTFKFSANITHTPGILTPGDFHLDRSGGHVVPRWKSPDVMIDCEFRWNSPHIMVSEFGWKSSHVMVSVSLGWKSPDVMVRATFLSPCWCLDLVKIDKTPLIYSFHISIWRVLSHQIAPCGNGTGRMWDMKVNSSALWRIYA